MGSGKINILAVAVAAVVYWLLGAGWFTILQKPWLAGIGKTMEQLQKDGVNPGIAYGVAFLCNLVMAYVLGWVMVNTGEQTAIRGVMIGALMWIGLVGTSFGTAYIFEARSFQIFAISAGYPLAGLLIMGAIVGAWKK
ncbi:MAG TPA: DUF1761 domain-containing protein [Bryobacteraceae bacterium]|nr:DUF1761 domain-containing protein [Bryobacteraceae bacterium]